MSEKMANIISVSGDVFEVVDEVPVGYTIWNIGHCMTPGYLPLCRLKQNQPFSWAREIEVNTLKAIRVAGAQDILAATRYGPKTPSEMKRFIDTNKNSENPNVQNQIKLFKKAIPLLQKVKGAERLSISEKQDYEEEVER